MECMTNNVVITVGLGFFSMYASCHVTHPHGLPPPPKQIIGNACVFFSLTVSLVLSVVPVAMTAERPFQLLPALQPFISCIRPLLRVVIVAALYTVAALLPDFAPAAGLMGAFDFVRRCR